MKKALILIVLAFVLIGCSEKPSLTCTIVKNNVELTIDLYENKIVKKAVYYVDSEEDANELIEMVKKQYPDTTSKYDGKKVVLIHEDKANDKIDFDMHRKRAEEEGYTCK